MSAVKPEYYGLTERNIAGVCITVVEVDDPRAITEIVVKHDPDGRVAYSSVNSIKCCGGMIDYVRMKFRPCSWEHWKDTKKLAIDHVTSLIKPV